MFEPLGPFLVPLQATLLVRSDMFGRAVFDWVVLLEFP
jgi:hypothetical protein